MHIIDPTLPQPRDIDDAVEMGIRCAKDALNEHPSAADALAAFMEGGWRFSCEDERDACEEQLRFFKENEDRADEEEAAREAIEDEAECIVDALVEEHGSAEDALAAIRFNTIRDSQVHEAVVRILTFITRNR